MNLTDRIVMGAVRGFLNGAIGQFTPNELRKAVADNRDLWSATPNWMKNASRIMKTNYGKSFKQHFDNEVTTDLILQWLEQDQPHLQKVFISETNAYQWLDKQVTTIKNEIKKL